MSFLYLDIETVPEEFYDKQLIEILHKKHCCDKPEHMDERRIKNGALFPETGEIKAIGLASGDKIPTVLIGEKQALESINNLGKVTIVGRNVLGFDIPFMIKRTLMNGRKLGENFKIGMAKPREVNVVDLMKVRSLTGSGYNTLESCCLALKIDNPKAASTGGDVRTMTDQEVINYCSGDVNAVREIHKKFIELGLI